MNSFAFVVACLPAVSINGYRRQKEKLPDVLEKYITESKKETNPIDEEAVKAAKEFVDKKLKDDEKAVTWAMESTQISALEGNKLAGQLHIIFRAKIVKCPSETQKKMSKMLHFAVKNPEDNCNLKVIDLEGQHPCSLQYSKFSGNSELRCHMLRGH